MNIATDIERLEQVLSESLMNEWESQGHSMTGKVVKEIEYKAKQDANTLILSGFMYPYGNIIAAGVESSKIPFTGKKKGSGQTGKGQRGIYREKGGYGTSLYIAALQNYVKNRMNISDEKKSLSIAFAIAQTQKNSGDWIGMPTRHSYKYSSTGKRTAWIEEAFKKGEDKITEAISAMSYNLLTVQLDVLLTKWQIELNKSA